MSKKKISTQVYNSSIFSDSNSTDDRDESVDPVQQKILSEYFSDLKRHISLKLHEKDAIIKDFEAALAYYKSVGVPLDEALSRLDVNNLRGFYARPSRLWYPLDNAAKIYPLAMRHGYMSVFRLSVYLKEKVIPEILQIALTFTIKRFPSFATTVKKGFFWHYLDSTKRRYAVEPESSIPCRPLKIGISGSQSFRVIYYENRISAEFFHILTDGTGGMVFLKTLTAEYLHLLGAERSPEILDINDAARPGEVANEFAFAEKTENSSGFVDKLALQFSGKLARVRPCSVLHFKMDTSKLKEVSKRKDATVTAYILSLMFVSAMSATDEIQGDISIQVPVNLRKFYPSETLRNFSLYCGIRFPVSSISEQNNFLTDITSQLREKASKDAICEMMNSTRKMVSAVRYIPLSLKEPIARLVYGFLGDSIFSCTLSNLGVVDLPESMAKSIESMDFVLGTALTNRAACSIVTVGNVTTLSISKNTADPSFEEALYDLLVKDGILPDVEGSDSRED